MIKNAKKYDVIIIGGGTSGCSAAYNLAKLKLKTLLVEKNNYLGGLMTGGLVIPVMNSSDNKLNCFCLNLIMISFVLLFLFVPFHFHPLCLEELTFLKYEFS